MVSFVGCILGLALLMFACRPLIWCSAETRHEISVNAFKCLEQSRIAATALNSVGCEVIEDPKSRNQCFWQQAVTSGLAYLTCLYELHQQGKCEGPSCPFHAQSAYNSK